MKGESAAELVPYEPDFTLRNDCPSKENVDTEIRVAWIGTGLNGPTGTVPVQHERELLSGAVGGEE